MDLTYMNVKLGKNDFDTKNLKLEVLDVTEIGSAKFARLPVGQATYSFHFIPRKAKI